MDMSLSAMIAHIQVIENDNSVDTTLLQTLIKRFSFKFAENVDCERLITSASVSIPTTGYQSLSLSANFLRPIAQNAFELAGSNHYQKFEMARLATGISKTWEAADYKVLYIRDNIVKINSPVTGTLNYWYFRKPSDVSLSAQPEIPVEYLIEGTRMYYQNAMGMITKAEMDAYIYQIMKQAKEDRNTMDGKINAYVYLNTGLGAGGFRR